MSLSRELISLIRSKPVDVSDLEAAALFVVDATASAIAGVTSDPGRKLMAWAAEIGLSGENSQPSDSGRIALLFGALTHILEVDDLHRASVVHPGCAVVPALWGLAADPKRSIDGRQALTAILHGYEAALRIGRSVGPEHYKIWHNTATCGPFGSAMAAACLLDLSVSESVWALGNAGTQSAGLWEFIETGAMSKHLHAGRAAEAGVTAAMLARHGFSGAPEILEGRRGFFAAACPNAELDLVLAAPDAPWSLHETSLKPWPSCRHTHPAIDAALDLHRQMRDEAIPVGEIAAIRVGAYEAARGLCDRPAPETDYAAKFSLQHCVAAALRDGEVWFESFDDEARASLASLRQQVSIENHGALEKNYPNQWGAYVALRLSSGQVLEMERTCAKGDPEAPLSPDEIKAKAAKLMAMAGLADPSALIDGICAMAAGAAPPSLPSLFELGDRAGPARAAE